jgi:oligopeptide transport system permease protein
MTERSTGPAADQRLQKLLTEAGKIHGVSLWQDAWRRLRRNTLAMLSLAALVVIAMAAFLTPLLPLQSPIDKDLNSRQLQPPNLTPHVMGQRAGLKFPEGRLTLALAEFERRVTHQRAELATIDDSSQRAARTRQLNQQIAVEHPFNQLWNNPGRLTRAMCAVRVAIFGDWAVPSICGTDTLGRDVLARIFWGARVSLVVGLVATFVSLVIGVSYGATAGYVGGRVDVVMMRFVDLLYSVPFIFVVIFLLTFLTEETVRARLESYGIERITLFYFLIGAIYWLTMSRIVRGQVLSLKQEQFVEAARTVGASPARIIFRHLVPNVLGIVIVYLTLTIPAVMLFEAFLSFLGLGVAAPDVSWGLLMNEGVEALSPVKLYWWLVVFPGAALAATLFALNFLGDGLRDALDPKMKHRD